MCRVELSTLQWREIRPEAVVFLFSVGRQSVLFWGTTEISDESSMGSVWKFPGIWRVSVPAWSKWQWSTRLPLLDAKALRTGNNCYLWEPMLLSSNECNSSSMKAFFLLQLFVFTDGEVSDTFTVINEVLFNSKKHRYEASTVSLVLTRHQGPPHMTFSTWY